MAKTIQISRRQALKHLLAVLPVILAGQACTRHRYVRPESELDLGPVKELLYERVHNRAKSVMLFRDTDGWSALSTRCTYEGCDLTFNEPVIAEPVLLCACCRTRYNLKGIVIGGGPATEPLPWIDLYYHDGHLYANPGKIHPAAYRFMTEEIRKAEEALRERIKPEDVEDEVKIPEVLGGNPEDREPGNMFLEEDPTLADQLKMIK
jgi:Rieske Fe-S protein